MVEIFFLLIVFQFKHLIADYYLQFSYMYMNKGQDKGWIMPLVHHAGIHGIFTFFIVIWFVSWPLAIGLMLFDFVTHFVTDRWKAFKRQSPDMAEFWTNLGIDQMVHHLVGILIVMAVVL